MRRNMHATNDCVRFNREKLVANEYSMKFVVDILQEIQQHLKESTYHQKMDTIDVSEFFPLKNTHSLKLFFNRVKKNSI